MRQTRFVYYVAVILFSFMISGCLSISNTPVPRFYTLRLINNSVEVKKFDIASKIIIGIGPIEIPEYQNRPQIVTQDKEGMLKFAQFERWGESLDSGLARLILENLTVAFPQAEFQIFPCNFAIPLDYQLIVNVVQLESQLDKEVSLVAQWTIIDSKTKEMLLTKRSQVDQAINPHTYAGLAQALSKAGSLLSSELMGGLSGQPSGRQQGVDFFDQLLGRERLGQTGIGTRQQSRIQTKAGADHTATARNCQNWHSREHFAKLGHEVHAIHIWHNDVGDDQVDFFSERELTQGFLPVRSFDD